MKYLNKLRILHSYDMDCLRFTDNFLRMTLPNTVVKNIDEGGQIGGQIGGSIGGSIQLTTRQKEILSLLEDDTQIFKKQLAQILKINHLAVDKHIESLNRRVFWKEFLETIFKR